jgi:hypothetical protein
VRNRPLAALSAAALSAVLLAGCATSTPEAETSPSGPPVADLCEAAAPSGAASDAVTVEGEIGAPPTATFELPLEITEVERTVVTEGEDELTGGDFISFAYTIFDAETGESLDSVGYTEGEMLPQQVSAESGGVLFGCSGAGSRIVAAAPAAETTPAVVYVIDVLATVPVAAWGEEQPAVEGSPQVELAENGAPSITIPDGEAPVETQVDVLKLGDGLVVEPGDTVLLQYTGVKWSDGTVFDSTWDKGGVPTQFATTDVVVGFQKALEGQTVGSQVLVAMTPADGYGEGEINEEDLVGETLVFVVDILGTQHAAPTQ